jgi:hypothetical protein
MQWIMRIKRNLMTPVKGRTLHDRMLSNGQMAPTLSKCQLLKITTVDHPAYISSQFDTGLAALSVNTDELRVPVHRLSVPLQEDIYKGI